MSMNVQGMILPMTTRLVVPRKAFDQIRLRVSKRRGKATALRNGSSPSSKSSTARAEEAVEKGPGMIKL